MYRCMRKEHSAVFQLVYVSSLRSERARASSLQKLHHYVHTLDHAGLTGVLMQGELATLGLVEGAQELVLAFVAAAHPSENWQIQHVMLQSKSSARLYPGLPLRLRQSSAIGEQLAFASDLRRTSEQDAVWSADSVLLTQWLEPATRKISKS